MMENIPTTAKMAMVYSLGRVVTYTRVTTLMMNVMATEKCSGLMVLSTKESGKWASNMAMAK